MKIGKKTSALCLCAVIIGMQLLVTTAIASDDETFSVSDLTIVPTEVESGELVTISVKVTNNGNATGIYTVVLRVNSIEVDSKNVTLLAGETKIVEFIHTETDEDIYIVTIDGETAAFNVKESDGTTGDEGEFRVGPVVRLRPVIDEMTVDQEDNIIELFMSNPTLNDVTLHVDAYVSVPANFQVYGEGFAQSVAAGTIYGIFSVPPGTSRTIYLNAKAVREGSYTVHFSGLYYPGENKDAYNPLSLTHPISVVSASPDESTNPNILDWFNEHPLETILLIVIVILVIFGGAKVIIKED